MRWSPPDPATGGRKPAHAVPPPSCAAGQDVSSLLLPVSRGGVRCSDGSCSYSSYTMKKSTGAPAGLHSRLRSRCITAAHLPHSPPLEGPIPIHAYLPCATAPCISSLHKARSLERIVLLIPEQDLGSHRLYPIFLAS